MRDKQSPNRRLLQWLLRLIQGVVTGGGAILPGISGGVLAVVFGIYQPMMELLSSPKKGFQKHWRLFLPIGIGWLLGFVLFSDGIAALMNHSVLISYWLFIGLIGGTMPSLYREAGREGRGRSVWISLILAFAAMLSLLLLAQKAFHGSVEPSPGWFFFCGILWGLSLIVPGMTSSSILISMDLLEPLAVGVGSLDPGVLLPMLLGIVLVLLLLGRLVNRLFQRHYAVAAHGILGVVLASTVVIIPLQYASLGQFLLCLAVAAAGFCLSWLMETRLSPQDGGNST